MTNSSGKENRLTDILEGYWNQIKGGEEFPSEIDVNPSDIAEIWDNCFLIKSDELEGEGFKYTFLGQGLINAYGDDISQDEVSVLIQPNKERFIEKVEETIKTKKPVIDESEFVNAHSVLIKYRKIYLPLGEDDHVTHVIGGMRWKGY